MAREFITAAEVAEVLGISSTKGYEIIRKLNKELEEQGYITVRGKVPKKYFSQRIYGGVEVNV